MTCIIKAIGLVTFKQLRRRSQEIKVVLAQQQLNMAKIKALKINSCFSGKDRRSVIYLRVELTSPIQGAEFEIL